MAHFAELNADNIVIKVAVVNNDKIKDSNGNESEKTMQVEGINIIQNTIFLLLPLHT
mgnify:CR=1 FL=1